MARRQLVAASLRLGSAGRARRSRARSFHRLASNVAERYDDAEAEGPTVAVEGEGRVPPLIRLESAVIRYPTPPPSACSSIDKFEFDCGLNVDYTEIEGDLFLESYRIFDDGDAERKRTNQRRLQRHWNHTASYQFDPFDLDIWPNLECRSRGGGHVVLGRNASGKTLLSRSLVQGSSASGVTPSNEHSYCDDDKHDANFFLSSGHMTINRRNADGNRNHRFLSHVSFDSHSDLLLDPKTTTVHRALIPFGGNRLSPTAKFLSVRLGMFPLLHRHVNTLSTGEIRRVLLVRALVSKPEVLVLDNAFDGLDVGGRKGVRDIVERVLEGFRMDILVQGVGEARDAARTQVLLLTHRPEEITDGMGRVTFVERVATGGGGSRSRARTEDRMGRDGEDLVRSLADGHNGNFENCNRDKSGEIAIHPWSIASDDEFPSNTEIAEFWEHGRSRNIGDARIVAQNGALLVRADNLKVVREGTTLLSHLDWTVEQGERWHLSGTNGAGKSTLARLLLRTSMNNDQSNPDEDDALVSDGRLVVTGNRGGVGWVSTELHVHAAQNWGDLTAIEILTGGASILFCASKEADGHSGSTPSLNIDIAILAARWLGLLSNEDRSTTNNYRSLAFLSRRFSSLSQGEQKMLLVASALAQRPPLLLLDEPCQGLDLWNRGHLLGLLERFCRATDVSLLYVTHHEEELIPSIGHRLHLEDGEVTYCGSR
mmetsp:Transcript_12569/g.27119  ORF Transcript_12569/g.27119 Transcript_12569/m.27119 type:complete len:712 (-) Transcript_12569:141-2276(-)